MKTGGFIFTALILSWATWISLILGCNHLEGQNCLPEQFYRRFNLLKQEDRFNDALTLIRWQLDSLQLPVSSKPCFEAGLHRAELFRLKGSIKQSIEILDSLKNTYQSYLSAEDPLAALYFVIRGTAFITRGELKNGRSSIEKAIEIYVHLYGPEDTLLGPCYNKVGNYFYYNKIYDSALIYYSKALAVAEKKTVNLEERASYTQNIGIIHLELKDYNKAEDYFIKSLNIKELIYSENSFSLGRIYMSLGRFYQTSYSLNKSLDYYLKAEGIFSDDNNPLTIELGIVYWNKGLIYHLMGDSELALTYLFNARKIIETLFVDNIQMLSTLYSDIGNIYKYTEQYDKAIDYYSQALPGADSVLKIKIYRNLASIHQLQGEMQRAGYYLESIMKDARNDLQLNNPERGLTFLNYGNYLLEMNADSAVYYFEKALEILSNDYGYNKRDIAAALYSVGDFYFKKNQPGKALQFYQRSLITISNSFSDTNIFTNPSLESLNLDIRLVKMLGRKALYLNAYFRNTNELPYLTASIQTIFLCLDLIDRMRVTYRTEGSQLMFSGDIYHSHNLAIEDCFLAYQHTQEEKWLTQAFSVSERGKSMILLNEMKDANAKKIGLIPDDLRKKEKEIKGNLYLFNNSICEEENESSPDKNKLDYFRYNLLVCQKKYDSLLNHLEKKYPDYYKLKYDQGVITVKQIQKVLEKDETLLEYTLTDENVYIFLISKGAFQVRQMPIDQAFIQNIFLLRDNLDFKHVYEYDIEDYMQYQFSAYELYRTLIKPVESFLGNSRLIIIPDGELNYLSFESLIEHLVPSDTINFRNLPYLIKKYPISYASSSTILSLVKKEKMPELKKGVLALAPSASMLTRSIIANNKALAEQLQLKEDLPGAVREAENILKVIDGDLLIGEEATESEFKRIASSFDILHFATHTRIDDENPLSSMLSFNDFSDATEDGVLQTYEIYNLELQGELAVLSACSTGNGRLQRGEGVISLARAFIYAGMPSVMMTLWDVEDISTGNIIPVFYYLLKGGYDKDIALRMAKLTYMEKTRPEIEIHPAFWSGFVLHGNNQGFKTKIDRTYYILLISLGILIIFLSFVMLRKIIQFREIRRKIDKDISDKFHREDRI
jgi:CHAT domain-containing protein